MIERSSVRKHVRNVTHALRLRGPLAVDPTARMLHALLLVLAIWYGLWSIILLPLYPNVAVRLLVAVLNEVGPVAALVLLRLGSLRRASLVYLICAWAVATIVIALNGGIRSPGQVHYVTLPILATWLLGYEAALWTASLCLCSALVFALLELVGINLARIIPLTPLAIWSRLLQVILIGAVPVAQVLRALRESLAQSRQTEQELQEYKEHLEQLVQQRTTELVEARDQAMTANRAKSIFLANMSHELRTPLNAILGFSNLLRERCVAEEQRNHLDIISRSGTHLLALINDVLDVAKIEAGGTVLAIAPCDLGRLVYDVTEMMRVRAEEKHLKLALQVDASEFSRYVRADAARLRQVLINLLGNAIKYTEAGFVILRFNTRPADDAEHLVLRFEIEDSGIGISAEDQTRIFDAFVQVGKTGRQTGTGLGLAITRQLVELMGGKIQVESTRGEGSLFQVEVPVELAREFEVPAPMPYRPRIIGLESGQPECRILIVDDERENWMLLERLLENAGFRVRVAADGAEGVEIFRAFRPHFIWMDLRMPVMDGVEAARRIRALDGGREVKIAAVTASVFAVDRSDVLAAGMDDFLQKPFRPSEIFDCMARHLGVRYRYREPSFGEPALALCPADLAALPEELRAELRDALISLNRERIAEVIGRVSGRDATLGSALAGCAERFAYTAILKTIEGSKATSARESV